MLDGYKTYIGAIGVICTGLGMIAVCIKTNDYSNLQEAFVVIAGSFSVFGIGGKLDKLKK